MDNEPYEIHEAAQWVPEINPEDYQALCISIRDHGIKQRIELYDGKIIDGRTRQRAAIEVGKFNRKTDVVDVTASLKRERITPLEYVIIVNTRRNLSKSQIALVLAKRKQLLDEATPKTDGDLKEKEKIIDQMLARTNVSERTLQRAERVAKLAAPEVVKAVENEEISLKTAEEIAKTTKNKASQVKQLESIKARTAKTVDESVIPEPDIVLMLSEVQVSIQALYKKVDRISSFPNSGAKNFPNAAKNKLQDLIRVVENWKADVEATKKPEEVM